MAKRETALFEAIRIEGGLFPAAMLEAIRTGSLNFMAESDYGIPKGLRLRDEIARAFRIALPLWQEYATLRKRTGSTEEDEFRLWHTPLFTDILGFKDLRVVSPRQLGERTFPINRETCNGAVPVLFVDAETEFKTSDIRFGSEGRRRSPAGLMQEYLNAQDDALYGCVCNGTTLRIYRDNHSLTRPAFLEVDFERMFTEELYADFALMYQLLHASRFTPGESGPITCILELWRDEAHQTGERAVEKLRPGVKAALEELANGFIAHPENSALRSAIESQKLNIKEFQLQLLRLVYRIIFISTAEDRGLLLDTEAPHEVQERYFAGYSIAVLREKAQKRQRFDDYSDCWQQLTIVFRGLSKGEIELALPALGGLFDLEQCPDLDNAQISNRALLTAFHHLSFFRQGVTLARINYRDMDSEELGSVYEGLLELVPQIAFEERPWKFSYAQDDDEKKGNARKLSGSYYTPDSLVKELIKSALDPVIRKKLEEHTEDPKGALLSLSVIDPACGSGHFLLAAARRIAVELAHIEAAPDQPDEKQYRHALREVISHCIYGVDLNPMAIELARTALWLEALEPGKPLSFLDAHIRCGNSLVGVLDPKVIEKGIPDDAFKPLSGDNKAVCSRLKKINKNYAKQIKSECSEEIQKALSQFLPLPEEMRLNFEKRQYHIQQSLFADSEQEEDLPSLDDFNDMSEDTLAAIEAKKKRWHEYQQSSAYRSLRFKQDAVVAPFYLPKTETTEKVIITNADYILLLTGQAVLPQKEKFIKETAQKNRFFHWHIEFSDVFKKGGFDCILGNPPWERIKLQEEEFFASRSPMVTAAKNKAERSQRIAWLSEGMLAKNLYPELIHTEISSEVEKTIYKEFTFTRRVAEATSLFVHVKKEQGGRFPLTGVGDVNLYALFTELAFKLSEGKGRVGIIVPSGLAIDNTTKEMFNALMSQKRLVSFFEFENKGFFKGAGQGHMVRFALVTMGTSAQKLPVQFMFQATNIVHLHDNERHFTLSTDDINLINPNTKTCPIFKSKYDAELTKKIYRSVPVLFDENKPDGNIWEISFSRLFDMANDSHLFKTCDELECVGAIRKGTCYIIDNNEYVPLYESKMVHLYNHRHGDFNKTNGERVHVLPSVNISELHDPNYFAVPYYWVVKSELNERLNRNGWEKEWLLGWRDVTDARASERTVISCVIPRVAIGHTFPCYIFNNVVPRDVVLLYANVSSIVLDYIARQKVGGLHLTYAYLKQFPVIPPLKYTKFDYDYITPRVLELTYTAWDLEPFARDIDFTGEPFTFDPDRRAILRAELDAYYAKLYSLTRDELRYILDPADLLGEDYPSETFRVLKNKENTEFGEYRTQRLVLEAWDKLEKGILT